MHFVFSQQKQSAADRNAWFKLNIILDFFSITALNVLNALIIFSITFQLFIDLCIFTVECFWGNEKRIVLSFDKYNYNNCSFDHLPKSTSSVLYQLIKIKLTLSMTVLCSSCIGTLKNYITLICRNKMGYICSCTKWYCWSKVSRISSFIVNSEYAVGFSWVS